MLGSDLLKILDVCICIKRELDVTRFESVKIRIFPERQISDLLLYNWHSLNHDDNAKKLNKYLEGRFWALNWMVSKKYVDYIPLPYFSFRSLITSVTDTYAQIDEARLVFIDIKLTDRTKFEHFYNKIQSFINYSGVSFEVLTTNFDIESIDKVFHKSINAYVIEYKGILSNFTHGQISYKENGKKYKFSGRSSTLWQTLLSKKGDVISVEELAELLEKPGTQDAKAFMYKVKKDLVSKFVKIGVPREEFTSWLILNKGIGLIF